MSIFDWLMRRNKGAATAGDLVIREDEDQLSGLSLREAIDSHMAWRGKLVKVLEGHGPDLEVHQVARDNLCVVGKWIYKEAKSQYLHLPEYEHLRKSHADFHLAAGNILIHYHQGDLPGAQRLLKTEFRDLSDQIQLDLVRLFTAARH